MDSASDLELRKQNWCGIVNKDIKISKTYLVQSQEQSSILLDSILIH